MEGVANEAASLAGHLKLVEPVLDLRRQPHHDRRQDRPGVQRRRGHAVPRPRLARAGGARCERSRRRSTTPTAASCRTTGSPTLIVVKSIIGYGAPTKAEHGQGPRRAARRRGNRQDEGVLRLADRREVPRAAGSAQAFSGDARQARREAARASGKSCSPTTRRSIPELAAELKMIQTRELPKGWENDAADVPGRRQRHGHAHLRRQGAQRDSPRTFPGCLGGSADLAPSTKTLLTFDEAGGDLSADNPGGRNMHFGIREHAHGRRRQRHGALRPAGVRRDVLRVHRLLPAVAAAGRDHEDPDASSCSRTIRSASAKMARRISRSSTWPPAARFRTWSCCGRATPTKRPTPGESRSQQNRPAGRDDPHAAKPADARPHEVRAGRRRGQRRLRPGRCAKGGKPDVILHGHRQRSAARGRRARGAHRRRHHAAAS